jgi:hypothetical protein
MNAAKWHNLRTSLLDGTGCPMTGLAVGLFARRDSADRLRTTT